MLRQSGLVIVGENDYNRAVPKRESERGVTADGAREGQEQREGAREEAAH